MAFGWSIISLLAGGGVAVETMVQTTAAHADQVLANSAASGTENTATGKLGSSASAGSDNASFANSATMSSKAASSSAALSANPSSYTDASNAAAATGSLRTDTASSAVNGNPESAVTTNTNGSGGVTSSGIASGSLNTNGGALNVATSNQLNSNGALQATSSGAPDSHQFDVVSQGAIGSGASAFDNGSYSWTVTAPDDLTNAGLSVGSVTTTTKVTQTSDGSGVHNVVGSTTAQLPGGTYDNITSAGSLEPSSNANVSLNVTGS